MNELKSLIPKPSEKISVKNYVQRKKTSQEESIIVAKKDSEKGLSFVTQEEVIAMLKNELHRSSEDWKYVPESPYPVSLLHIPCPKNYETSNFVLFNE
ncbi:hypothetical protein C1H46_007541 [Malus baccata]|uniref:Uncharacterized protein n=1 Tax=Malus baccata TaxID=106549 RepID=A0A540N6Z1_MALBA|nr:hypothetical protein C1H46_007541 [Malus baccata]